MQQNIDAKDKKIKTHFVKFINTKPKGIAILPL